MVINRTCVKCTVKYLTPEGNILPHALYERELPDSVTEKGINTDPLHALTRSRHVHWPRPCSTPYIQIETTTCSSYDFTHMVPYFVAVRCKDNIAILVFPPHLALVRLPQWQIAFGAIYQLWDEARYIVDNRIFAISRSQSNDLACSIAYRGSWNRIVQWAGEDFQQ